MHKLVNAHRQTCISSFMCTPAFRHKCACIQGIHIGPVYYVRVLAGKMLAVYVGALQQHKLDFIHALADDSLSSSDTSEWHPCSFRCQRGRLDSAAGPVYWHLGLCTLRVPVLTEYFRVLSSQYVGVLWRGHLIFLPKF